MSADNEILILQTCGPEFRVAEVSSSDNMFYYDKTGDELWMWDAFRNAPKFYSYQDAAQEAIRLEREIGYTEYGITRQEVNKVFPTSRPRCPDHVLSPNLGDPICYRCGLDDGHPTGLCSKGGAHDGQSTHIGFICQKCGIEI